MMNNLIDGRREVLPSGTVTFLFTDIEGSTAIARNFPGQLPALLERHHAIIHQSVQANHGYVFQIIGDAFCVAFHTAADALFAALSAQRLLQGEAWDPAPVRVRMGIHTGAAQADESEDGSRDYRGYLTLACTQSIMTSAHGGQVLLSGASSELVRGQLPEGVTLLDMGEHRLKGGSNPEHLWQMVACDLRAEFPPLKTLSVLPNNLPVQVNSFVGRERELAQTKDLLSNTHLLTLTGPGGTGKTRLSLQLAAEVLPGFADGVWLVELAALAEPVMVLPTIASVLGVREIPGAPLKDQLAGYLHPKSLLLILDNCEHLVEACAVLADDLLRRCPSLKIVASSREALGIAGETIFRVPPLALPDQDGAGLEPLRQSEAVQLFIERAAAARPGFALNERNASAVAQICLRLDGIPLALELAAARVSMLTPEQIAARLDDRFRLLTGGSRTALPRQQTLRSLIDWSYDLLSDAERQLFCQLSAFVGGWSLEAAEAVCPDLDVLALLSQLVQKSLVVAVDQGEQAETRFHLLETIRQYGRDRLLETGLAASTRDHHLGYYLKLAETGDANFAGPLRLEWMDRFELELDNFRAAFQWALDHDIESALHLGGALSMFLSTRNHNAENRRWLQNALEREAAMPEPEGEPGRRRQAARARGLLGLSQTTYGSGYYQTGLEASQEAVRLYRLLGDLTGLGMALGYVGSMAAFQGDLVFAEQELNEAIRVGREIGDKVILCFALGVLSSFVYLARGDIPAARAYCEESVRYARELDMEWAEAQGELILARIATSLREWEEARRHILVAIDAFRSQGDTLLVNMSYSALGDIELLDGNLAEARQILQECLLNWKKFELRSYLAHTLESFAYIAHAQNQPERAARLLSAAEAVHDGIGTSAIGVERIQEEYEKTVNWLHTQFDESAYQVHWSEGCGMSVDQAISYALA